MTRPAPPLPRVGPGRACVFGRLRRSEARARGACAYEAPAQCAPHAASSPTTPAGGGHACPHSRPTLAGAGLGVTGVSPQASPRCARPRGRWPGSSSRTQGERRPHAARSYGFRLCRASRSRSRVRARVAGFSWGCPAAPGFGGCSGVSVLWGINTASAGQGRRAPRPPSAARLPGAAWASGAPRWVRAGAAEGPVASGSAVRGEAAGNVARRASGSVGSLSPTAAGTPTHTAAPGG